MFDSAEKPEVCRADRDAAIERFAEIRRESEALTANLTPEDQSIQSMADVSPTKWHLAHTTWFFETFLLRPHARDYRRFDPAYEYLFNSYYEAVGPRHPRRDLGSPPSLAHGGDRPGALGPQPPVPIPRGRPVGPPPAVRHPGGPPPSAP